MLHPRTLYPVDLSGRPRRADGEAPRFMCLPRACWPLLVALGQSFGWQPAGTVADEPHPPWARADHCGDLVSDYEIPMAECAKCVTAEDAGHWADALAAARRGEGNPAQRDVLRRATEELQRGLEEPPSQALDELIGFFRAGAFAFYVTD